MQDCAVTARAGIPLAVTLPLALPRPAFAGIREHYLNPLARPKLRQSLGLPRLVES